MNEKHNNYQRASPQNNDNITNSIKMWCNNQRNSLKHNANRTSFGSIEHINRDSFGSKRCSTSPVSDDNSVDDVSEARYKRTRVISSQKNSLESNNCDPFSTSYRKLKKKDCIPLHNNNVDYKEGSTKNCNSFGSSESMSKSLRLNEEDYNTFGTRNRQEYSSQRASSSPKFQQKQNNNHLDLFESAKSSLNPPKLLESIKDWDFKRKKEFRNRSRSPNYIKKFENSEKRSNSSEQYDPFDDKRSSRPRSVTPDPIDLPGGTNNFEKKTVSPSRKNVELSSPTEKQFCEIVIYPSSQKWGTKSPSKEDDDTKEPYFTEIELYPSKTKWRSTDDTNCGVKDQNLNYNYFEDDYENVYLNPYLKEIEAAHELKNKIQVLKGPQTSELDSNYINGEPLFYNKVKTEENIVWNNNGAQEFYGTDPNLSDLGANSEFLQTNYGYEGGQFSDISVFSDRTEPSATNVIYETNLSPNQDTLIDILMNIPSGKDDSPHTWPFVERLNAYILTRRLSNTLGIDSTAKQLSCRQRMILKRFCLEYYEGDLYFKIMGRPNVMDPKLEPGNWDSKYIILAFSFNRFPKLMIKTIHLNKIRQYLLNELRSEKERPKFVNIVYKLGVIYIQCIDEKSALWFQEVIYGCPKIKWPYIGRHSFKFETLHDLTLFKINVDIPLITLKDFKQQLFKQHPSLHIEDWLFLKETKFGETKRFLIEMSKKHWDELPLTDQYVHKTLTFNSTKLEFRILDKVEFLKNYGEFMKAEGPILILSESEFSSESSEFGTYTEINLKAIESIKTAQRKTTPRWDKKIRNSNLKSLT